MKTNSLKEIIASFKGRRIAVVGDLMLDTYVWGDVTRISQEAPVPVVHAKKKTYTLGAAANVMRNIVSLGGEPIAFGMIGDDPNGKILLGLLEEWRIDSSNVIVEKEHLTIEKQRVIAGTQQIARVDYENLKPAPERVRNSIIKSLIALIEDDGIDAIIFEDYAKGLLEEEMLDEIINCAKRKSIMVALDPHPKHNMKVKNLNLITPNHSEAFALAGVYYSKKNVPVLQDLELEEVARRLYDDWNAENLLITLGPDGMALFTGKNTLVHIPTRAKEVFDVSGAGDTVIAVYVLACLGGGNGEQAAQIANHAAGIVVGKVGTAAVTVDEIVDVL